jgi:hypothetical protein
VGPPKYPSHIPSQISPNSYLISIFKFHLCFQDFGEGSCFTKPPAIQGVGVRMGRSLSASALEGKAAF